MYVHIPNYLGMPYVWFHYLKFNSNYLKQYIYVLQIPVLLKENKYLNFKKYKYRF